MTNGTTNRDFASLLDELLVDSQIEDHVAPRASLSFDYVAVADELLSGRIKVADETVAAEYRETGAPLEASVEELFDAAKIDPEPEAVVVKLPSVDPKAISSELGIKANTPVAQLARIRRAFAFENHPDRVAPHLRQRAMVRMQVANMLIDDARRRASGSGGR